MSGDAHRDEHDQEIDPNCKIGDPSKSLQRSNLAKEETGQCPNEAANGVAQLELRHFGKRFAIGYNDDADGADEEDRLEDVDQVSRPLAVDAECEVAVGFNGILVGVET